MRETKHCPKCGSTNIDFLAFYRPSIWRCLDCGYEGALIIEGYYPLKEIQKSLIIDWVERQSRAHNWNTSINEWQKP